MRLRRLLPSAVALFVAAPAWAHPGHGDGGGFVAGLLHPFTGADHLAAMLMIGAIAGLSNGRARAAIPLAFVAAAILGFATGVDHESAAIVELLILVSVIVAAAIAAAKLVDGNRFQPPWLLPAIALFGAAHGFAHGSELSRNGSALWFGIGFVAGTISLQSLGYLVGRLAGPHLVRRRQSNIL
ncbi:HupE/UreJ family protein [soil metagenome]